MLMRTLRSQARKCLSLVSELTLNIKMTKCLRSRLSLNIKGLWAILAMVGRICEIGGNERGRELWIMSGESTEEASEASWFLSLTSRNQSLRSWELQSSRKRCVEQHFVGELCTTTLNMPSKAIHQPPPTTVVLISYHLVIEFEKINNLCKFMAKTQPLFFNQNFKSFQTSIKWIEHQHC